MKLLLVLALLAPLALASQSLRDAASDAVAAAEKMLLGEMTDKMINGATSRKGKKVTDM